jgi:exosortase
MQLVAIHLVASQPLPLRMVSERRKDTFVGWLLAALFGVLWVLAIFLGIESLGLLCTPAIAFGVCVALGGRDLGFRLLLPASLVAYGLPIWEPASRILQSLAILTVGAALEVVGMPAAMDGAVIFLPAGSLEIAEGCSGVSFFITALAVGTFIAATEASTSPRVKVMIIASFAVLGLVANWVRIFVLAVLAFITEMRAPVIHDHYWFGWLVFAAVMLPAIYKLGGRGSEPARSLSEPQAPSAAQVAAGCLVVLAAPQLADAALSLASS